MTLTVAPIYAALLALLFVALTVRVIMVRNAVKAPLGDAGDDRLSRAIRAHGNFAEFAPFGVLLIAIAELAGSHAIVLHLAGAALLAGRLAHAYSISNPAEVIAVRAAGMMATMAALLIAAGAALF